MTQTQALNFLLLVYRRFLLAYTSAVAALVVFTVAMFFHPLFLLAVAVALGANIAFLIGLRYFRNAAEQLSGDEKR